jgi:hypothetical protein
MHIVYFICPMKPLMPSFLLSAFSGFMVHGKCQSRVFLEVHKSSESAKIKQNVLVHHRPYQIVWRKIFVKIIIHRGRPTFFHDTITMSGARANSVCKDCSTEYRGVYIHTVMC